MLLSHPPINRHRVRTLLGSPVRGGEDIEDVLHLPDQSGGRVERPSADFDGENTPLHNQIPMLPDIIGVVLVASMIAVKPEEMLFLETEGQGQLDGDHPDHAAPADLGFPVEQFLLVHLPPEVPHRHLLPLQLVEQGGIALRGNEERWSCPVDS